MYFLNFHFMHENIFELSEWLFIHSDYVNVW